MRVVCKLVFLSVFALSCNFIHGNTNEIRPCNEGLGYCTPFYKCSNATVFNDGKDHIGVRFNVELETDLCHYLEMCCDPEDILPIEKKSLKLIENPDVPTESPENQFGFSTTQKAEVATPDYFDEIEAATTEKLKETTIKIEAPYTFETITGPPVIPRGETLVEPIVDFLGGEGDKNKEKDCDLDTHECIPFFYCAKDHTSDGTGSIAARLGDENKNETAKCSIPNQVCCHKQDNLARYKPEVCGKRNVNGLGFQVTNNVDEAQYAEFPWMTALTSTEEGGLKYICGASLIHPHVVLTAAHCVDGKSKEHLKVRLGEWDSQTENEMFPHADHEVAQIITHADFGRANLFNDVALLVLKTTCQLSAHVNTICLPPQNHKFENDYCFASGWGSDKYGEEGSYRANLKKIKLPIVPLKVCQENLRATRVGPKFKIHTNFMCAGGEKDVDTCTGDGGSPLVCKIQGDNEYYYQAGIVSWGIECGQENVPGVYANVARFRNWIDHQMNQLGYGTSSYSFEQ